MADNNNNNKQEGGNPVAALVLAGLMQVYNFVDRTLSSLLTFIHNLFQPHVNIIHSPMWLDVIGTIFVLFGFACVVAFCCMLFIQSCFWMNQFISNLFYGQRRV